MSHHPRFRKVKDLNKGAFGFVQLALDRDTGDFVAIKFLLRGPHIDKNVEREILNHRRLLHHHVIQFKGVFLTTYYLGIVLEYAKGGDLLDYMAHRNGLTEDVSRWVFQQLIVGLDYIHRMGVANRDIKLENTLVDEESGWPMVKICDFGYSKHEDHSKAKSFVGTRPYLAPEVIKCKREEGYDAKKADIWSTGVFLYVMLVGAYPFERSGDPINGESKAALKRIQNADYIFPKGRVSESAADLIRKILETDPEKRLGIREIQNHEWYQKNLPDGVTELNDKLLQQQVDEGEVELQPVEDIMEILEEARIVPEEVEDYERS